MKIYNDDNDDDDDEESDDWRQQPMPHLTTQEDFELAKNFEQLVAAESEAMAARHDLPADMLLCNLNTFSTLHGSIRLACPWLVLGGRATLRIPTA
jgi:hypothetical protein